MKNIVISGLIFFSILIGYGVLKTYSKRPKHAEITIANSSPKDIKASKRDSLIDFAFQYLGKPYIYGSCNKDGFDCSGFVFFVFKNFNIKVPRSSSEYLNFGKITPLNEVKKGDILVFLSPTRNEIGHLGIVTKADGMKTEFIHSSSGKEMSVIISSLKQEGYKRRFVKAINVLEE